MIQVTRKPLAAGLKSKEERAQQLRQVQERRKIIYKNFLRHRSSVKTS